MALYTVSSGTTINANDINQLVNVLQQPSGGVETGTYYLTGVSPSGVSGLGAWVPSLSRQSAPVSVSVNTSVTAPSNCSAPGTDHLSSSGFHVFATYTATNVATNVAGTYTIQY